MASFGWKRKIGEKVSKETSQNFEKESAEGDSNIENDDVDWLHSVKRKKGILLEDNIMKSTRLKDEGSLLALNGRYWEAVKKWDEGIQLTPEDATLYEMKSQSLLCLHEIFPAVQAAETAVKRNPHFVEAWQTLGRAQLELGEIAMAIRSFQVALHLCPSKTELWEDDLNWARQLLQQKREVEGEDLQSNGKDNTDSIPDYDFESDEVVAVCDAISQKQKMANKNKTIVVSSSGTVPCQQSEKGNTPSSDDPASYIKAR